MPPGGGSVEIDSEVLIDATEKRAKEITKEAARRGYSKSQKHLKEAIEQRAGIDSARDQRGSLEGRESNGMFAILQSGQPPAWDESQQAWVFSYTHFASMWHEMGTEPHEIEAEDGFLAFQWPDAPDDVVSMFSPGGDDEVNRSEWDGWVYFKKIDHPGTPAIGFVRAGVSEAERFLKEVGRQ